MKIYKVYIWDVPSDDGEHKHTSIKYTTNQESAKKILRENVEGYRDEVWMGEIKFELNKKGILEMLNNYFAYPDNG